MPMDWRVFGTQAGAGIQQTGQMVSQALLQGYARKLDEKYAKGMMDYQDQIKAGQEEREFERDKEEREQIVKENKDLFKWEQNLKDERKVFGNNPYWQKFAQDAMSPEATDLQRTNLTVVMAIRERLTNYLPLEKKHMDFMKTLPPAISIDLYAMLHHNQQFLKELEVRKVQAEAMGKWYGARPDIERTKAEADLIRAEKAGEGKSSVLDTKILNAQKRITDIEKTDDFQKPKFK